MLKDKALEDICIIVEIPLGFLSKERTVYI